MFIENYSNPYPVVSTRRLMLPQYRVSVNDEGLSGINFGKIFKNFGVSLGRIASAGLWDPSKNRFYVPFSSGHMRTLAKGWVGGGTLGLVNSDKFFDTRTMRTIGTVAGAVAATVTGAVAAPAVLPAITSAGASIGSMGASIGSALPSLSSIGTGLNILSTGMGLMRGFSGGGGASQEPQVIQEPQVVQEPGQYVPTVVNPVGMYPYAGPQPYTYDPYGRGAYVDPATGQIVRSPSWRESVRVVEEQERLKERKELLPGNVEVFTTVDGVDDVIDSWGRKVRY
jgi:hypothetical protein